MISKKYTRDYKIELQEGRRGKLRSVATYDGEFFTFLRLVEEVSRSFRLLSVLTVLLTASILTPLFFSCAYCRQLYLLLPLAIMLLPVYHTAAVLYRVQMAGSKSTRQQRDKICNRFPAAAIAQLVLALIVLIGSVVFAILGELETADWIFTALALLRVGLTIPAVIMRNDFAMQTVGIDPAPEIPEIK